MSKKKDSNNNIEILIVEDSPTQLEQLRYILEEQDYKVITAINGKLGLEAARKEHPAIIISDIVMPEMNGYELCKSIRSDETLKDTPIVLLTSLSTPADVIEALKCGADNFIRKPYDEKHLLLRVDNILTNRKLRSSDKMKIGVELYLGGSKHFITAEKQQILDLLISTYEQAVELCGSLRIRERQLDRANKILAGIYNIAKGLNQAVTEKEVLEGVLERALELPDVKAGWIFIRSGESEFKLAAAKGLPDALSTPVALEGDCLCKRKVLAGEIEKSSNILECERLLHAKNNTQGLRSHVTLPLRSGNQVLGIINLVGEADVLFSENDLRILNGIGNQIGTALERTRMHEHLEELVKERTAELTAEIAERKRAEETLRNAEARYRALFDQSPNGVLLVDIETGKTIEANETAYKQLGYTREEFAALRISDYEALDTPEEIAKRIQKIIREGSDDFETLNRTKSGELRNVHVWVKTLQLGERVLFHAVVQDITARKQAENQLRALSAQNRLILDSLGEGIYGMDLSGKTTFINPAAAVMLGYTVEELINQPMHELLHHSKPDGTPYPLEECPIYAAFKDGLEHHITNEVFWKKDGTSFPVEYTSTPIRGNGSVTGAVVVFRDITERKQAEINLKRRDAILETISISAEKFLTAKNINEPVNETLRLLREATDASRVYIFKFYHSEDGKLLTSQTHEYVKQGITPQIDNPELQNLDIISAGYNRWVKTFAKHKPIVGLIKDFPDSEKDSLRAQDIQSIVTVPIYVLEKLYGFIGFDECLYERVWSKPEIEALQAVANLIAGAFVKNKIGRELVVAKEKAEEMNRLKSIFLSNMSHELRTPLISVLGFSELLQQELKDPEHLEFVNHIVEGGQRLNNTLSGILEISKLETATSFVNLQPHNLAEEIKTRAKSFLPMAQSKRLFLKTELSDTQLHAHIDTELFGKALYHLVSNGIKFTKEGGVFVTLNHERIQDQDWAVTKVIDTGVGIPNENFDKIFGAFRQSNEGYGRSHEGTGLGLTIAKRIVELMKGKIEVESEVGKGSVFSIWLPAILDQNQIQQQIEEKLTIAIVRPPTAKEKGLQKILVVEDNSSNRMLINRVLTGCARIMEVEDGISGVTFASKERFDLILMDINLGAGIDGVEAMHQIRKIPGYARVPIIAVTAYVMFGDKERFLNEGFDDYLGKPFTKDVLLSLIEKHLKKNG